MVGTIIVTDSSASDTHKEFAVSMIRIEVKRGSAQDESVDALLIPVGSGPEGWTDMASEIDQKLDGELKRLAEESGFNGQAGKTFLLATLGAIASRRICLVGSGLPGPVDDDHRRRSWANALRSAVKSGARSIAISLEGLEETGLAVEGMLLGNYRFVEHLGALREPERNESVAEITIFTGDEDAKLITDLVRRHTAIAEGVYLARDLVSEPAGTLNPATMASRSTDVAKAQGLGISVLGLKDLERLGAGAIIGVGKGSDVPPCLIHLVYRPDGKVAGPPIGLVGKCITFDTGGYSIKTGEGMLTMKEDMAGGAAVLGAMRVLHALDVRREVHGVICVAENMISGAAFRPGDVLTAMNGVTIEITSTDAEGRLVLADGLVYTARQGVSEMVDLATLTGAAVVALGETTALFSNDDDLANRLLEAANRTGERTWRMPLIADFKDRLKGEIADLKNTGGRPGGAIIAALFLEHFSEGIPWAHLDIAGSAGSEKTIGYTPKGATGVGVRTLLSYLTGLSS
jgi:leucyl aminopeptidase